MRANTRVYTVVVFRTTTRIVRIAEGEQLRNAKRNSASVIACDAGEKPAPVLVKMIFLVVLAAQRRTLSSDEFVRRNPLEGRGTTSYVY